MLTIRSCLAGILLAPIAFSTAADIKGLDNKSRDQVEAPSLIPRFKSAEDALRYLRDEKLTKRFKSIKKYTSKWSSRGKFKPEQYLSNEDAVRNRLIYAAEAAKNFPNENSCNREIIEKIIDFIPAKTGCNCKLSYMDTFEGQNEILRFMSMGLDLDLLDRKQALGLFKMSSHVPHKDLSKELKRLQNRQGLVQIHRR